MHNFAATLILVIGLLCPATLAVAHGKLTTTQPNNGAVLAEPPATIELNFAKEIRLTKVWLRLNKRDAIALDLSDYKYFAKNFSLRTPHKERGTYAIEWRALGSDGHVLQGAFAFVVQ